MGSKWETLQASLVQEGNDLDHITHSDRNLDIPMFVNVK